MVVSDSAEVVTLDEFKAFVTQPEHSDRWFELINGEIIELSPGRTRNSELTLIIASVVRQFCKENKLPCHVSGEAGAYNIQGHVIAPDFAYKPTPMSNDYPDHEAPLWAAEIISPTDKAPDIRAKRQIYLQAGILYWEIYPEAQSIDVYTPGQAMQTVGIDGVLNGGDILPGFELPVKVLFDE